jgi:protein-S-isoprenylcysteine O-methyltransferase Ste14
LSRSASPVWPARSVQTGAYGLVRHPIYGGLILGSAGWGLARASPGTLVLTGVLAGFFELKSRREEAWLGERFAEYAAYRARTPRLIPGLGGDRD